MNGMHDVAQICLNGHVINDSTVRYPEHSKKFCDKCGKQTITKCKHCKSDIQGDYHVEGVASFSSMRKPPSFCHNCGEPYPWTESKIQAAKELAEELDISKEDKTIISDNMNDVVGDTPKTKVAATRINKVLLKAGKTAAKPLRELFVDIASETAKKIILGDK